MHESAAVLLVSRKNTGLVDRRPGADDFVAIAEFGKKKREWLAKFLDLQGGIPSHDRFNAIFAAIQPAEFEKCLLN